MPEARAPVVTDTRGGMFLIRWISGWPLGLLHAAGGLLGWLVWLCSPTYRRRLRTNADLAGVDARARRRSAM